MNKHNITCANCGKEFQAARKNSKCSQCRHEDMKARAALKGPCILDGCEDPQFCKSMCNRHYWADRQAKAPRESQRYEGDCKFCGKHYASSDRFAVHCSLDCAMHTRSGHSPSREIALRRSPERASRMWVGHTIPARAGRALAMGPCAWCGVSLIGQNDARYCSKRCSEGASWKRRYDTRGEFYINPRVRREIYERDSWTCQICHSPVPQNASPGDLEYPTLDHIIPQSLQLIPDHSPANLRLSHMLCNARRGNRADYEVTA